MVVFVELPLIYADFKSEHNNKKVQTNCFIYFYY